MYICSAQFANLPNFEIVLRKLEIAKLQTNFETRIQFQNCAVQFGNMNVHTWSVFSVLEFVFRVSCSTSKFWGLGQRTSTVLFAITYHPITLPKPKKLGCKTPNPKHKSYIASVFPH